MVDINQSLAARGEYGARRAYPNIGMSGHGLGGQVALTLDNTSTTYTFEDTRTIGCAKGADAIILGYRCAGGGSSSAANMSVSVAAIGAMTDAAIDAATYTTATFGGSSTTISLAPGPSAAQCTHYESDPIRIPTTARTDGGTLPMLNVRSYVNGGILVLHGVSTDTTYNLWAAHPSGRIMRTRVKTGNFATANQATFSSGSTVLTNGATPLSYIKYLARGKVVNVVHFGDSIDANRATYKGGGGFAFDACVDLTAETNGDVTFEYSSFAWEGQVMASTMVQLRNALTADIILPRSIILVPVGSPNDLPNGTITTEIDTTRTGRGAIEMFAAKKSLVTAFRTLLPTNTGVKNYGASDSLRVAYNAELLTDGPSRGLLVADTSSAISGVTTGGQVQMAAGAFLDGIHPNDAGNDLMRPSVKNMLRKAAGQMALTGGSVFQ